MRLRSVVSIFGGGTPDADENNWDGEVPFVTPPDLRFVHGGLCFETSRSLTVTGVKMGSTVAPKGAVLISKRAPIGYVSRLSIDAAFNQGCLALIPRQDRIDAKFLTWALSVRSTEMQLLGRGTTFMEISVGDLANLIIWVPDLPLQQVIVDYLDREITQIDTLIRKQKQLIKSLRERKKSLVQRMVHQGIQDKVPMRYFGLAWLPLQSPAHWVVRQLGFDVTSIAGLAFSSQDFIQDGETRLLRGINIKPDYIDWSESVYWNQNLHPVDECFILKLGDLVLGLDRPFIGQGVRVAEISANDLPALLVQRVMALRAGSDTSIRYVKYLLLAGCFQNYLEPLFTGVSIPHVSEWQVRKFRVPVPPLHEQESIADKIVEASGNFDSLISKAEKFVALARERRSALITAAVTGQIDVRAMA